MSDKSKTRKKIPPDIVAEVFYRSDSTCCICRIKWKSTQIHHIDDDPSNNDLENLALLCLGCHDDTQIRGGFGRRLAPNIVIKYRNEWYKNVEEIRQNVKEAQIKALSERAISLSSSKVRQKQIELNDQEIETVESNDELDELIRSVCRNLGIKRTMLDFQEVFSVENKSKDKILHEAKDRTNKWAYDIVTSLRNCGVDLNSVEIHHEDYLFKVNGGSFWVEVNTKPDATSDSYPNNKAIRAQLSWDKKSNIQLGDFLKNLGKPYYAIAYELFDEIDVNKMKEIIEKSSGLSFRGEGTRNGQLNQIEYEIVQGLRLSIRRYYDIDKKEGGFLQAWDTTAITPFWKLHEHLLPSTMFYIMIGEMTPKQVMKIFDVSRIPYTL